MIFGVFAVLEDGEKCFLTKDEIWTNQNLMPTEMQEIGLLFGGFQQAKHWLRDKKEFDRGKVINVLLTNGEFVKKIVRRVRIELIKRNEKPTIPSKKQLVHIFKEATSEDIFWGVHFTGSVRSHQHNNLSMRDIKEGFAIHPLKVPLQLMKRNKETVPAYVGKLYNRILQTWLLHLMTNQTEILVKYSSFTERELLQKIYKIYEAIEFEDDVFYQDLVETYKREIQETSSNSTENKTKYSVSA